MDKQKLHNKDIRRIGEKVLFAVRAPDQEVEAIVSTPDLFARIKSAQVSASEREQSAAYTTARAKKGLSALHVLRPRYMVYTAAVVALFLLPAVVFLSVDSSGDETIAYRENVSSPIVEFPLNKNAVIETQPRVIENKVSSPKRTISRKRIASAVIRKEKKIVEDTELMSEFQAVTYTGEVSERLDTDRVVRVQISRASLFAMGVDVPVDSGTEKIKADLLIGDDGVMKGVRIEKQ